MKITDEIIFSMVKIHFSIITVNTVIFADVDQQSTFVWSSVSLRKQSGKYKNHVFCKSD